MTEHEKNYNIATLALPLEAYYDDRELFAAVERVDGMKTGVFSVTPNPDGGVYVHADRGCIELTPAQAVAAAYALLMFAKTENEKV